MVGKLGIPPDSAARRVSAMCRAFRFAEVHDHERLEGLLTNDPKDRHVLACAIAAQVHTIVTFNLKDFPQLARSGVPDFADELRRHVTLR